MLKRKLNGKMAAKNNNITKDPVAAAKKGAITRRGRKKKKTIVRMALGLNSPEKLEALKNRIDELTTEFMNGRAKKNQMVILKEIIKYVHPQKRTLDISGDASGVQLNFYLPEKKPIDPEVKKDSTKSKG